MATKGVNPFAKMQKAAPGKKGAPIPAKSAAKKPFPPFLAKKGK